MRQDSISIKIAKRMFQFFDAQFHIHGRTHLGPHTLSRVQLFQRREKY